jgi:hypothetical protein
MKFTLNSKNLLQALFIVVIGFLLFNLAFILLALILNGISMVTQNPVQNNDLGYLIFLIVLLVLSWVLFQTKLSILIKASFLTMPVMSVLVMIGILMFGQPSWLLYGVEGLIIGLILVFLRQMKQPWQYTFAVLY